jgi:hypothetical protein
MLPRGGDRRLSELQGQVELTDTPRGPLKVQ